MKCNNTMKYLSALASYVDVHVLIKNNVIIFHTSSIVLLAECNLSCRVDYYNIILYNLFTRMVVLFPSPAGPKNLVDLIFGQIQAQRHRYKRRRSRTRLLLGLVQLHEDRIQQIILFEGSRQQPASDRDSPTHSRA